MDAMNNDRANLLNILHQNEIIFHREISDGKSFSEVKPIYFTIKKIIRHLEQWKDAASWVDADDVNWSEE